MPIQSHLKTTLELLKRALRAHGAYLFVGLVPGNTISLTKVLEEGKMPAGRTHPLVLLELECWCSDAMCIVPRARIRLGSGTLGWIASHGRTVQLAPFEGESTSLGLYGEPVPVRSLLATPIVTDSQIVGLLMVDSESAAGFAPDDRVLIERTALQLVPGLIEERRSQTALTDLDRFRQRVQRLGEAIGKASVNYLRLEPSLAEIESSHDEFTRLHESYNEVIRLLEQLLPPHFPMVCLAHGGILVALDALMLSHFARKMEEVIAGSPWKGMFVVRTAVEGLPAAERKTPKVKSGGRRR